MLLIQICFMMGISQKTVGNQLLEANRFLKGLLNPGSAISITAIILAFFDRR